LGVKDRAPALEENGMWSGLGACERVTRGWPDGEDLIRGKLEDERRMTIWSDRTVGVFDDAARRDSDVGYPRLSYQPCPASRIGLLNISASISRQGSSRRTHTSTFPVDDGARASEAICAYLVYERDEKT
jgi:hypothetical protein